MLDIGKPRCKATISPELVRVLRGLASGLQVANTATPSSAAEAESAPRPDLPEGEAVSPDWATWVLRIDGTRPRRFKGLLLYEQHSTRRLQANRGETSVARHLRLFLTEDRDVVGHVAWHQDGPVTARPIFRAMTISCLNDLDRLIASGESGGNDDVLSGADGLRLSPQSTQVGVGTVPPLAGTARVPA